jgi:hypothetical protein
VGVRLVPLEEEAAEVEAVQVPPAAVRCRVRAGGGDVSNRFQAVCKQFQAAAGSFSQFRGGFKQFQTGPKQLSNSCWQSVARWRRNRSADSNYDAFGLIGTTFRELDWKTLIFFERVIPISPNAS